MLTAAGIACVFLAVLGGFVLEGGNLWVLVQPGELLIIGGAAVGAFVIASSTKLMRRSLRELGATFRGQDLGPAQYLELLRLLFDLLMLERSEGMVALEDHVNDPAKSRIFGRYGFVLADRELLTFICDNVKVFTVAAMEPHEADGIMETDIAATIRDRTLMSSGVARTADSLPGLGIVAAVLGVVLTMGKMKESPEVLGLSVGAALVGTFLGVLLCYGVVGPLAAKMELRSREKQIPLEVVRITLMGLAMGLPPTVAVEAGRRAIPAEDRPSFDELEQAVRHARRPREE